MAVGYVNGSMASDVTTDGGSAVITLGWTPSAGELLVVVMKGQYSATLPTWGLTAFTALSRQSTGTSGVGPGLTATQVWYKTADGTETSLTFFAVWYAGGIALVSGVGAVLGSRMLRW